MVGWPDFGATLMRCSLLHNTAMPGDDWNAMGTTHHESFHKTLAAANTQAASLAQSYQIPFEPRQS